MIFTETSRGFKQPNSLDLTFRTGRDAFQKRKKTKMFHVKHFRLIFVFDASGGPPRMKRTSNRSLHFVQNGDAFVSLSRRVFAGRSPHPYRASIASALIILLGPFCRAEPAS
jgi:hypothetical protein